MIRSFLFWALLFSSVNVLSFQAAGQDSLRAASASISGQTPNPRIPPQDAAAFSKQIERVLAARNVRVALVFRAGRPAEDMPNNVRYTHGAFWVNQDITLDDGRVVRSYAVYNLYAGSDGEGDPSASALVQDFPFDFAVPMAETRAGVIVPTAEMQTRILGVMGSPLYERLHQPTYSLVSNPADLRYQNCNEFYLDVVAAAGWELSTREVIKERLADSFSPVLIETSALQRFFAPWFTDNIKTRDHKGGIRTTTYLSLAAFMQEQGWAQELFEIQYVPEAGANGLGAATPIGRF